MKYSVGHIIYTVEYYSSKIIKSINNLIVKYLSL